jgi:hypothetical protein
MEGTMLLAEPIFACLVGIAAVALVIITAPVWTAAASDLGHWVWGQLTQAGRTIDESIHDNENEDKDKEHTP